MVECSLRFLLNPYAGRGRGKRRLSKLRRLAAKTGGEVLVSCSASDLEGQARHAARQGVERLVAVGGDGTFHHVIRGLQGTNCDLGLVTIGRGNDLSSSLSLPRAFSAGFERAVHGSARPIDLGAAGEIPFSIYCGIGFDSEAAAYASAPERRTHGPWVYVQAVLRTLARFEPPTATIEYDGGHFHGKIMFAVVANCPRFGGGMRIAPAAELDDGYLELVIVEGVSRLELLKVFPRVYSGRHVGHPAIQIIRTRRAHIGLDREMVMYVDGEPLGPVGQGGIEVVVRPAALRVVS